MHTKGKMYVPSLWMEKRYAGNGRKKNPKNVSEVSFEIMTYLRLLVNC